MDDAWDAAAQEGSDNDNLALLLGFLLRETDCCIDVGANRGRFLWEICRRAPRGHHIAWEPIPELARELRQGFPQVEVHQAALADRAGIADFVLVHDDPGYSGLRERTYPGQYTTEHIEVRLERLDDVIPSDYVPAFIKIDVEGGERQVFEGAMATITRHKPVIVFEHGLGASDHYGTNSDHIYDLLVEQAGLRLFDLSAEGPYSRERFAEVFASARRWNFIART